MYINLNQTNPYKLYPVPWGTITIMYRKYNTLQYNI